MNEIYEALQRKVSSGTCSPLELYNIKMYIGLQAIGREGLKRISDKEIADREEVLKDKIDIHRWPDGTHFYAKVGKLDVVDDEGNVKWNTYKKAMEAAEEFIKQLK